MRDYAAEVLRRTADPERRAAVAVLVALRWVLVGAAVFQVNYRPGSDATEFALLMLLIAVGAALNALLQWMLSNDRPMYLALPALVGIYDAVAITGAIAAVDGFDNPAFVLYYPALLSFVLVFPGRRSIVYTLLIMAIYAAAALPGHGSFDFDSATDQKALALRLVTLAATALAANLVVRMERNRRMAAVAAEARRNADALAAERRAAAAEQRADDERHRLAQEVHDGISQNAYMLSLGLETAAASARKRGAEDIGASLDLLHQLSRETLLESRHLLFDLGPVLSGRGSLEELVRNVASEFAAVTGIATEVSVTGRERALPTATTGEVYRLLREALANVLRHAGARHVTVHLAYDADGLRLRISDDGRGFEATAAGRGHGLSNMRERAERLGGTAAITSIPGDGTAVEVCVPFNGEVP